MAGKFEIYKDKAGEFRFRLKAANGQNILSSKSYKTRRGVVNGVESVRKNAPKPDRFEKIETASGKFAFQLKAANGRVIGSSHSYNSDYGAAKGIEAVERTATSSRIEVEVLSDKTGSTGPKIHR